MVSALVPRASGLGLSPGQGHCVVFLDKTLYFCAGKSVTSVLESCSTKHDNKVSCWETATV